MGHIIAISVGGAVGALGRFGISRCCARWLGGSFAFGTLVANVLGCFLLGFLFSLRSFDASRWGDLTHSSLTIGFLGALTTFSAFGLETTRHFQAEQLGLGFLNIAGNLLLGLAGIYLGMLCGRWCAA